MDIIRILRTLLWSTLLTKICLIKDCSSTACPTPSTNTGPPFPTLPDSYQVGVEANIIDKNYTTEANIYYDFSGNRATIKLFADGDQATMILSYQTNEIFFLQNSDSAYPQCIVSTLDSSDSMNAILFGKITDNGRLHIATAQTILSYGVKLTNVYIGNDTVRGITVDHWHGCGTWSGQPINVDYYFTSNWRSASTAPSIPIRAEVSATKGYPNGTMYHIHHVYDFFSYRPVLDIDPSIFQTPSGVVCPGRKNTKPIIPIPDRFYYRLEKVYSDVSVVSFEDIWYDESYRVFRRDYKPLTRAYPTFNLNPVSEVHDFTRGVRYIMDKTLGNCTTIPISNNSMDAVQNITAQKVNGSFVLDMKNPLQFFDLEYNYTYIGQQQVRGIFCDVYVALKTDLFINGFVSSKNTVITIYFLNQQWADISENTKKIQNLIIPMKMDIQAVESGISMSYNFVDFDSEPPKLSIFDISQCYHEASKLTFKMTFPGTIPPTLTPTLLDFSQLNLAQYMGVSVLRVTDLHLDYDDAFVYITSTLLDRTLASAQFTIYRGTSASRADDVIKKNVVDYEECATFCLTNDKNFICNSFDFCNDNSCHLSRYHVDHGAKLNSTAFCDHFSRNVQGAPQELSLTDAFKSLRSQVYTGKYFIDQFTDKSLIAVDVEILFGWANYDVSLPAIPKHFSYRMESTVPAVKQISAITTWYDGSFNLLRYDQHVNKAVYPFYTTDPMTIVEDYNNGIKYVINKMQGNCTMSKITKGDVGTELSTNSTWQLVMKNPVQIFYIDNTYRFVGQQTIRGMTCNVFESLRTDFRLPNFNANMTSLFRYAFLADGWSETDSAYLRSTDQPVRLEITVEQFSFYTQFNFYEFSGDTIDLTNFDIHQCFDTNQTQPFQIVFKGNYHPNLDTTSKMFIIESVFKMANLSSVSALRFQRTSLSYDNENIYLTSSLVEHRSMLNHTRGSASRVIWNTQPTRTDTSYQITHCGDIPFVSHIQSQALYHLWPYATFQLQNKVYFTPIPNGAVVVHADKVLEGSSPEICASDCLYHAGFKCNSFYVCKESNQCLLSAFHVPDGPGDKPVRGCSAYSRTVQDQGTEKDNLEAYIDLKNAVYSGNLTIDIPIFGTENTQTFVASSVRNPMRNPHEVKIKEMAFKQFTKVADNEIIKSPTSSLSTLSVDDCAQACLDRNEFVCDGFGYYPHQPFGPFCSLIRNHPELLNTTDITLNTTGSLFLRKYLTDFVQTPGVTPISSYSNAMMGQVQTDEACAKMCFTSRQLTCRSFQYCQKNQQCLLFVDRVVGTPNISSAITCNHYTSTYDKDFKTVDTGYFAFRPSLLSTKDASIEDCAKFCNDQQRNGCKGFYYCPHEVSCFLTSAPPDSADVNRTSNPMNFCHRYSRIHFAPGALPSSSGTKANTMTVTSPVTPTTLSSPTSTATSTSTSTISTSTTSMKSTTVHTTGSFTTTRAIPTPDLQHRGKDPSKANNNGELVGLSIGMLLLGIVIGVVALHAYRRYRGLDKDELKTNFALEEDNI